MELNWIRVEDDMSVDNGYVQKFLVCTTNKSSCFKNCDIKTCYFTDRFRPEKSGMFSNEKITHWAKIEKPIDLE